MCRKTVGVRDAVMAVLLVEASMQTCALIPGITNLHASFPEESLAEYLSRGRNILMFVC